MLRMIVGPLNCVDSNAAWYDFLVSFASWEGHSSSTRTATWVENLVGTMPQTSLAICDACYEFA